MSEKLRAELARAIELEIEKLPMETRLFPDVYADRVAAAVLDIMQGNE